MLLLYKVLLNVTLSHTVTNQYLIIFAVILNISYFIVVLTGAFHCYMVAK